jgi:hypothetical protein
MTRMTTVIIQLMTVTMTTMLLLRIISTITNYNLSNVLDVTSTFYTLNMSVIVKTVPSRIFRYAYNYNDT